MTKDSIKLWLLLAISFAIFFAYSLAGDKTIAGLTIKSSNLAGSIIEEKIFTPIAEEITVPEPKPLFPQPVDTATQTILFIGDCMLDGLSPRLAAYAKQSGHTQYSVIWYSSSTEQWGKSKRLTEYINKFKPTFIFICLGSNELIIKDIKTKRKKYVDSILNEIDTIPFLWIGPPNWKKDTGINDMLVESLPKGTFFMSNGMTFSRRKDGAHPTASSAILWMDSVIRWMPDSCLHPIRLDMPETKTARPKKIFVHQPEV